jgi:hypothetical protein
MGCRIALAEVGFDFDDTGGEAKLAEVTDQQFAQEVASHAPRTATEEYAVERADRRK